ncbi:Asp23/Gls24 family envelope stress response protein [Saccharomonospora azurea]|nr:Asp23/Gls24 family envelope stress response protein [Saccharomonospora azurea]
MTGQQDTAPMSPERARPGRTELGRIDISDDVVAKIAAYAAAEIPDAGSAASGFGRMLGRRKTPGVRRTSLTTAPKTIARVDGATARLSLVISVRWPAPIPRVCAAVRRHVGDRVAELTGLVVTDIDIEVTDLTTGERPRRVDGANA